MKKAVLLSINPRYVRKILDGVKTIEVRKSAPKLETPFKVFIYCTKSGAQPPIIRSTDPRSKQSLENVVAEFTCTKIERHCKIGCSGSCKPPEYELSNDFIKQACLSLSEISSYANRGILYGWHISDLKVYGKPKPLTEFQAIVKIPVEYAFGTAIDLHPVTRAPQSWCYVWDGGTL